MPDFSANSAASKQARAGHSEVDGSAYFGGDPVRNETGVLSDLPAQRFTRSGSRSGGRLGSNLDGGSRPRPVASLDSAAPHPVVDDFAPETVASTLRVPTLRHRSYHFGKIYKALLILAIAVTVIALLPSSSDNADSSNTPADSQSSSGQGAEENSEPEIDPGSVDAPPPNVLVQPD